MEESYSGTMEQGQYFSLDSMQSWDPDVIKNSLRASKQFLSNAFEAKFLSTQCWKITRKCLIYTCWFNISSLLKVHNWITSSCPFLQADLNAVIPILSLMFRSILRFGVKIMRNVTRFARSVEKWDILSNFQTLWRSLWSLVRRLRPLKQAAWDQWQSGFAIRKTNYRI